MYVSLTFRVNPSNAETTMCRDSWLNFGVLPRVCSTARIVLYVLALDYRTPFDGPLYTSRLPTVSELLILVYQSPSYHGVVEPHNPDMSFTLKTVRRAFMYCPMGLVVGESSRATHAMGSG